MIKLLLRTLDLGQKNHPDTSPTEMEHFPSPRAELLTLTPYAAGSPDRLLSRQRSANRQLSASLWHLQRDAFSTATSRRRRARSGSLEAFQEILMPLEDE